METTERNLTIIRYNLAGIVMNLGLAALKLVVGKSVNSHAIMLDGVNSLSDSLSSSLSILSAALGNKKADKNHPMGYGRLEYLCTFAITAVIIYVGIRSIIGAVDSVIHPHEAPHYNNAAVSIMVISLSCKLIYGVLMRRKGRSINSAGMIATGSDSLGDALISIGILTGILVIRYTELDIEHYICILISLLLINTGIGLLKESMDKLLGTKVDPELKKRIVRTLMKEPEILNVSNMTVHNYGENVYIGSLDIEVDSDTRAEDITRLSRRVITKARECGVKITSVGITAADMSNPEVAEIWDAVINTALRHESVTRVSSLNVEKEGRSISFYIVQDYSLKDREKERAELLEELREAYPDMNIEMYSTVDL